MDCFHRAVRVFVAVVILWGLQDTFAQTPPRTNRCDLSNFVASCYYRKAVERPNTKVLVFAHGVYSGANSAWGDPTTTTFWPYLVTNDPRFNDFDIYLLHYESPYTGDTSNIYEVALQQLKRFINSGGGDYAQIHFIAHSMGGLVVKEMLTMPTAERRIVLDRTRSVVLLATPSQGVTAAAVGFFLGGSRQAQNMQPAHLNTYLQKLEDSWIQLMETRQNGLPHVSCAHEIGAVTIAKHYFTASELLTIVPREAANTRCDGGSYGMNFNHIDISKPTSLTEDPYFWTMVEVYKASQVNIPPPMTESWMAVVTETDDVTKQPTQAVFSVELSGSGSDVAGSVTGSLGRSWIVKGYRRREFLAFTYQNTRPDPAGIGNYMMIRNAPGTAYVGYLTGTDCSQNKVVRLPIVMVRAPDAESAVKAANVLYPEYLKQAEMEVMPMHCPKE